MEQKNEENKSSCLSGVGSLCVTVGRLALHTEEAFLWFGELEVDEQAEGASVRWDMGRSGSCLEWDGLDKLSGVSQPNYPLFLDSPTMHRGGSGWG